MRQLNGLKEYLEERYALSVFDTASASKDFWVFNLHGDRSLTARVADNDIYDIKLDLADGGQELVPKVNVKYIYPFELAEKIQPQIKLDKKVQKLEMAPIVSPHQRYFIKNKSLYPLMMEKEVVFFTLLEGDVIRGLIADFSQYDITVNLKGGVPVAIFRHSVYDLRNKKGRCFLKSVQKKSRDWQKSKLFVSCAP